MVAVIFLFRDLKLQGDESGDEEILMMKLK